MQTIFFCIFCGCFDDCPAEIQKEAHSVLCRIIERLKKKKRKCRLQLGLPALAHLKIAPLGMDLAGRQM